MPKDRSPFTRDRQGTVTQVQNAYQVESAMRRDRSSELLTSGRRGASATFMNAPKELETSDLSMPSR